MTWQEFQVAMPGLPQHPSKEQWQATVAQAEALLDQVDPKDRALARVIIGDTLGQVGAFMGFIEP